MILQVLVSAVTAARHIIVPMAAIVLAVCALIYMGYWIGEAI